jgi:hypothetical protein
MPTFIQRPTGPGGNKHEKPWVVRGSWGSKQYPPMSRVDLWETLHQELVECGVLPADSPRPSNNYHSHLTEALESCSWVNVRWQKDPQK